MKRVEMESDSLTESSHPMYMNVNMEQRIISDGKIVYIIHEMADGTVMSSISEYAVNYNDNNAHTYWLLADMISHTQKTQVDNIK